MKNQKTGWKCSKLIYKAGLYREMQLFLWKYTSIAYIIQNYMQKKQE